MKNVLLILIVMTTIAACKKSSPEPYKKILPKPTCHDKSDDGRYETWDTTILYYNWANNRAEYTSLIDTYYVSTQRLDSSSTSLQLVSRTFEPSTLGAFIVKDSSSTKMWANPQTFHNENTLDISELGTYPNGCYRLFYFIKDEKGTFVTKGHYDIEVSNP